MASWLDEALYKVEHMPEKAKQIRELAMNDLFFFAKLVNPGYMYGSIHKEIYEWMQDYSLYGEGDDLTSNKLIMMPRAHLKSHQVATTAAWLIVRHPEITMLYLSATAELAQSQLYDIKNILDSANFRRYFPEYVHPDVGKREKWSSTSIMIDHPKRKKEGIRDATIKTAGLTTNTTGWHADVILADDIVVPDNAYTEEGRDSVAKAVSQFTSIRNTGGFTLACGTRYHPADIYGIWKELTYDAYTSEGDFIGKLKVWDIKEHVVEIDGLFLWPRVVRKDNKAFGFDRQTLSRIEAEYLDKTQFFAQYYNDPNDPGSNKFGYEIFQYYDPRYLVKERGAWYFNGNKLNVYAAVDFAYSLNNKADYTAIVVIGIDADGNIYVLDIDRFKTVKIIDYFQHIKTLHNTWDFKKIQAEVTAAQKTIVESIKDYVRKDGMRLRVEEFRPTRHDGSKEQRISAILDHRYDNMEIWHREGGWTKVLEEELVLARPPHDDIKDALASAVSIAVKPARSSLNAFQEMMNLRKQTSNNRFGGFNG